MWIRSQDEAKLINVNTLDLTNKSIYAYSSLTANLGDVYGEFKIGTYETKERALQVLDYIQNAIKKGEKSYTMPEK